MNNARPEGGRIIRLDGIRGIAILCVLFSHSAFRFTGNENLSPIGHFGVLLFFALSGYLITLRLLDDFDRHGSISLRKFYTRRAFRILPPAVTYLLILALLTWLGVVVCSDQSIRAALFFYVNYIKAGTLGWRAGHFWSLSVEEHFYLIWPALLVACRVRRGWIAAALLAIAINLWRYYAGHHGLMDRASYDNVAFRTDSIADTLLWGCCLAFVRARLSSKWATALVLVAIAFDILLMFPGLLPQLQRFLPRHFVPVEQFLPTLILAGIVLTDSSKLVRALEFKPLRWLGLISYSLYIWQQMFLTPGGRLPLIWDLGAAVVAAYLSYTLIETPCIAYGRKLLRRKTPPLLEPTVSPASAESA